MQRCFADTPPGDRRASKARTAIDFAIMAALWGLGPALYAVAFLWFLLA